MFGINLGIILLLIMVVMGAGWAELTENSDHDWTITSTEAANLVDSIELSEKKADVPGVTTVTERSNLGERNKFFQVYQAKGGDVFTPQGIRDICKAEALLIEADEFANGRAAYESRDDAYPGMCLMVRLLAPPLPPLPAPPPLLGLVLVAGRSEQPCVPPTENDA
jgi:hypothetical protein